MIWLLRITENMLKIRPMISMGNRTLKRLTPLERMAMSSLSLDSLPMDKRMPAKVESGRMKLNKNGIRYSKSCPAVASDMPLVIMSSASFIRLPKIMTKVRTNMEIKKALKNSFKT